MIHYNTVNEHLRSALERLMGASIFDPFRFVGGTSLSLQIGHRLSVDIDLFTDAAYGSINFDEIDTFLSNNFEEVQHSGEGLPSFGKSYFITANKSIPYSTVKLDVFYSPEQFVNEPRIEGNIRMATI